MPCYCIVCKKQPIPGDNTRSFHKFPYNTEQREKWMQAIGVSNVSKNAKVCSDHFYHDSFHDTDGYTTLRRLLSNAIPYKTLDTAISANVTDKSVVPTTETEKVQDFTVDQSSSPMPQCSPIPQSSTITQCSTNMSIDNCLKRKTCMIEVFDSKKKIRFMDGPQATYLSREDFSSDQSWVKFIKYHIYRVRQRRADRKRRERKNKKIENLVELVKSLREEYDLAANYVEVIM